MEIGYRIEEGRIRGPFGDTGYTVTTGNRIMGPRGYTRHWIFNDHIYSAQAGNTGYWIKKGKIHGPVARLPWEASEIKRRRAQRRRQRGETRL